jgi:hypothetical protein
MDVPGRHLGSSGPPRNDQRWRRSSRAFAVVLFIALASLPLRSSAQNVAKVLSATIQKQGDTTTTKSLALDLANPGSGITSYSIPPGGIVEIDLKVIAAGSGVVGAKLMDEDIHEAWRGWDDELGHHITYAPFVKGDTATIRMFCGCGQNADEVDDLDGSGEQSTELYIRAGDVRIPAGMVPRGSDPPGSYWAVDCDKTVSRTMGSQRDTLKTFWGDTLVVPNGALATSTTVQIFNMAPLLHVDNVPSGYQWISEALTLQPDLLAFSIPPTLVFRYKQGEVGELADEQTLKMFRYDPTLQSWFLVPGSVVRTADHTLRAEIPQFGTYGFAAAIPSISPTVQQAVATQFGDNNLGLKGFANGSELDQLSMFARDGWLYLYFGGNLESNFNNLELFFDTVPGGQHRLRGNNPSIDSDGLNRMGDDGSGNGLTFDDGFDADYWIGITGGDPGTGNYTMFANYASLPTGGGGIASYLGETGEGSAGVLVNGTNPYRIGARIDNSNVAGVASGCDSASPGAVDTGIELAIPWQAVGDPTAGCIKVCAFLNGTSHAFVSNQILGPLPYGTCNLGEPRLVNFNSWSGAQYAQLCSYSVVDVPSPPVSARRPVLAVWPNPAAGAVTIELGDWSLGDWSVDVFDLAGRRVQRFPSAAFRSGRLVWDGSASSGTPAPAGLYMVRLRKAGQEHTVRFLKLR